MDTGAVFFSSSLFFCAWARETTRLHLVGKVLFAKINPVCRQQNTEQNSWIFLFLCTATYCNSHFFGLIIASLLSPFIS